MCSFLEALGSPVGLFTFKVQEKAELLGELVLRGRAPPQAPPGLLLLLLLQAWCSVGSLVDAALQEGAVSFIHRVRLAPGPHLQS